MRNRSREPDLVTPGALLALLDNSACACERAYWAAPPCSSRPLAVGLRIKTTADFHATHGSVQ